MRELRTSDIKTSDIWDVLWRRNGRETAEPARFSELDSQSVKMTRETDESVPSSELDSQSVKMTKRGVLGRIGRLDEEDPGFAQPQPIRRRTNGGGFVFNQERLLFGNNIEPSDGEDPEYAPTEDAPQPLSIRRRASEHSRVIPDDEVPMIKNRWFNVDRSTGYQMSSVSGHGNTGTNSMANDNMVTGTEGAPEHLEMSSDESDGLSLSTIGQSPVEIPKSPKNHRHIGEAVYLERNCTPCDLAVTVFANDLPTSPTNSCDKMIKIDEVTEYRLATFFQSKLQLSILISWGGVKFDYNDPDIKRGSFNRAEDRFVVRPEKGHYASASKIKPKFSHAALYDMSSVEISISDPLVGPYDRIMYRWRQDEMKVIVETLAQELASFKKLEYFKIVLVGWGRGQTFMEGRHGDNCVTPFCDVLLDRGVRVGIELLIWQSSSTSWVNEEEGWKVEDLRRSMTPKEEEDFSNRLGSRRTKLGRPDVVVELKHQESVTLVKISE